MRLWFLLSCMIMAACCLKNVTEPEVEGKIVGGVPVSTENYPSLCLFFNVGSQCAGTIINSWTLLTAAHCFDKNKDREEMVIECESRYLYDFEAKKYNVRKVVIHEEYNRTALFACDIALIFLSNKIKFGPRAKKSVLVNHNDWMNPNERNFVATGWGWTSYGGSVSSKGLLMAELRFVSPEQCGMLHNLTISRGMFCLYGGGVKDTCKGDSGGGVLWKDMLVGIVSHGDGCAGPNKPSVYTNVYYFRQWIKDKIKRYVDWYCEKTS